MPGWLLGDDRPPLMVISTDCGRERHDDCQTPNCGCMCHEPGGSGPRHYER